MWDWLTAQAANMCLVTSASVFWLKNASDLLIGGAYALIPFGLASFLSARRDVEFGWLAWCFALFIALCGATHWMHIWLNFFPHYTAEAYLKAATALASLTTAGAVLSLLPDIKRLPTPAMLRQEHAKRIAAEVALREALEERSDEELQRHIETQDLLIGELNHRVKNTLTTVQALAQMSLKGTGPESQPAVEAFQGRLLALSAAHNLLNQTAWTGASLADVVRVELAYGSDASRVSVEGPPTELSAREVVSLALVIHELATNALKYGGMRPGGEGRVAISWRVEGNRLTFCWDAAASGHETAAPPREGFGLRMIRRTIERELGGTLEMDWQPDGLKLRFTVPLDKRTEPMLPSSGMEAQSGGGSGLAAEGLKSALPSP